MNLISKQRADNFDKYQWLCDPNLAAWIIGIVRAYGKSIVDVGCGNGYMFDFYVSAFDRVAAIDPSKTVETQLREKAKEKGVNFKISCAEDIPFESKNFDIAIAKSALHHFGDSAAAINEMVRVASKAIVIIEVVAPTLNAIPFLEKLLIEKEPGRSKESIYTASKIDELIMNNSSISKLYRHFYDQYIDLDTWIEYSDLPSLEKAKIRNYLDQMDPAIKTDMQYHVRNGRLSMLRRMYMAVAFIS